jgi:uncharacterized protein (TIGR03437 family)
MSGKPCGSTESRTNFNPLKLVKVEIPTLGPRQPAVWRALLLGVLSLFGLSSAGWAQARPARALQDLTVKNFINPEAPLVRETPTLVEGVNFTDETAFDPIDNPTELGGVQLSLDGVPQRLRFVSPTRIVFILSAAGAASRTMDVRTKSDGPRRTQITLVNAWPGLIVQSSDEESAFVPSGYYVTNPGQPVQDVITSLPLPVGQQNLTLVTVRGSGMRLASSIQVRLNGTSCPVVKVVPDNLFAGQDELVFLIPRHLAGAGAVDLTVSVAGRESNYARLVLGNAVNN